MIPLSATVLADVVGGELLSDTARQITGVSIDSRTVRPGDLFVPLAGEHTDGHAFIAAAVEAGAAAYLCRAGHKPPGEAPDGAVVVDDPLDALTGLAAWVRDEVDPTVVAITGSNGKTTTKDMAAAAIGAERITVANPGSFNNEIGLPLTLCLLTRDTQVLVCEIGARGPGHIADVMPMVRPDVAVVTTIAGAHIGEFGSLDAIAAAKGELVEGLDADGIAVLNADVPAVLALADRAPGRVMTVGRAMTADLHPDEVTFDDTATATLRIGQVTLTLPRPGVHQVGNALAALAAAMAVGVPLDVAAGGLAGAGVSRWRMEVSRSDAGITVVNDAYNANPHSVAAALDTLATMRADGRRWAVLGYMAELGDHAGRGHQTVGSHAAAVGVDVLLVVEARAGGIADGARQAGFAGLVLTAADVGEAGDILARRVRTGDVVLVKASRSVGLEQLAEVLMTATGDAEGAGQ
ncbi:MAG TPA: UDP-N-acetylmuramoyl-tripeptide--D-alanyl-D-alanine ligase [Euzebya sp.]|nr:UDP-N-acetylmuramoyl-tripeptide--D-alanyl-D-alanine ligase [Euzebya sp.]